MRLFSRKSVSRPRSRFRPSLEALEERWVPSTITVTSVADSGKGTLRNAINNASGGDTINFAPGLIGQTITLSKNELEIDKNLTIVGPGAGSLSVSGGNTVRVFNIDSGVTASIGGLTIANGLAVMGAGIANVRTLFLSDSVVTGNAISDDFNVKNDTVKTASAIMNQSEIFRGGGIENIGTLTVNNCTISKNGGDLMLSGGGINNVGTLTVKAGTISGNSSGYGFGGGIYNEGINFKVNGKIKSSITATATVTGTVISNNIGSYGGGVNNSGVMSLVDCTVIHNTVDELGGQGGGIATWNNTGTQSLKITGGIICDNGYVESWPYESGYTGARRRRHLHR